MKWPGILTGLAATGEPFVIVTVAGTRGSTPRETGAKLFVTPSRVLGTIGGGQLEYECTAVAAKWFRESTPAQTFARTFTLGANCGQCCGGVAEVLFEQIEPAVVAWPRQVQSAMENEIPAMLVTVGDSRTGLTKRVIAAGDAIGDEDRIGQRALVLLAQNAPPCRVTVPAADNLQVQALFEPLRPAHFEIVLFGAGHVGSALVANLAPLNCRVVWIDGRADIFPDELPANVEAVGAAEPQRLAGEMPAGCYFLVMTHSHALDLEICSRILARDDFSYCGLIGSRAKRRQFEKRLRALGLSETRIARLVCPIGIAGITGKRPAEIAVAVTAQLLSLREAELAHSSHRGNLDRKKGVR